MPTLTSIPISCDFPKCTRSSLFDSLGKLDYLENLKLWNDVFPQLPYEGKIRSLPQSNKFPSKLKKLTIVETMLDWKHMSTLGLLKGLEILKLKDNAFTGDLWKSQDGGFRSLVVLHIGRTDLVFRKASALHFPSRKCLHLNHCSKFIVVPFEPANVPSFQILDLNCTTRAEAKSAKKRQLSLQRKFRSIKSSLVVVDLSFPFTLQIMINDLHFFKAQKWHIIR
ncbi:Hypothetical predicted protein [Olea europaea subsp. europaea]|uniref:Uncharacterized protein n=1 Tax=Olea europaea subsp. europaea TaxID=158383 RepID=A0A8S0V2D6_OLEEU|nr:Hypothetical predicted protein [Olea europaea subsp. europaea]